MPSPEALPTQTREYKEWPVTVGTHQSRRRAVMPRIQVLAVIKDDLGLWVCSNEFGSKYRACRIRHGNGVSDKGIKVVSCECGVAVKGPKPSFPYQRTGLAQNVIKEDWIFLTSSDTALPTAGNNSAAHR